ncbi:MAG: hypothetical protein CME84_07220 [Henriciella sp.]|uniref:hypothetical protein n=1 Tax=uncultured Henriciella sp. TaxID=1608424 RepID=UPI000C672DF1|nr:hypothetical protein [Henriciella sp.]QYJ00630.1 hypothetical protein KUV46_15045 [Thalassovita mediterranea]|tara:strand:- start:775 stop:1392 length:618 start_codon:yes stop_codon:yes gene_type:complete
MIELTDLIVAGIGLAGVLLGSLIAVSKDAWASSRQRRRDGSYAAIRLACLLDEYADKCIDVVQDDGTAYGQPAGRTSDGQEYLQAQVATPGPPDYPDDIAWRSLDEKLMHRILALPNMARSTDRHIDAASDYAHPPDFDEVFEARQQGYARIGLESLEIASALRKRFEIESVGRVSNNPDWNPEACFRETLQKFEARRKSMEDAA